MYSPFTRAAAFLLILCLAIVFAASCADTADSAGAPGSDTIFIPENTETEEILAYDYTGDDYGGYEYLFLGQDACNWANCIVVPEELNGELLNDAMYNRNKAVEERLNITITFEGVAKEAISPAMAKTVTSGDDVYDTVFFPNDELSASLTKGYFINLAELEPLRFDQPWWDRIVIDMGTINGRLFFASSDISLFPFEATWVLYFNETIMKNLNLDFPYEAVRQGRWTIDRLAEYARAAANLNGDTSFAYNNAANAQYGVTSHSQFISVLLCGAQELFISLNEDGLPYFSGDNERFYAIAEKITGLTGTEGQYTDRGNMVLNNAENSLSTEFKNSRFMFMSETLGHISNLRDLEDEFGVVPAPKFDEEQQGYNSMIATWGTLLTVIPVTAAEQNRCATVLDLMSYQSYITLMEPYYDTYLTQKGARNDNSAEMLAVIRETRTLNIGVLFGWTTNLQNSLATKLIQGNSDVASTVATALNAIETGIEKTIDSMSD